MQRTLHDAAYRRKRKKRTQSSGFTVYRHAKRLLHKRRKSRKYFTLRRIIVNEADQSI